MNSTHTCNPSMHKATEGGPWVQGQSGLQIKILSGKQIKKPLWLGSTEAVHWVPALSMLMDHMLLAERPCSSDSIPECG